MLSVDESAMTGVCARLLGRPVVGVERIAGGRNSQVFRLDCAAGAGPSRYVAKQYVAIPEDPRDRLQTEYHAFQFLRLRGVTNVPEPIAMDATARCAIYEFVPGDRASRGVIGDSDIRQAIDLLADLKAISRRSQADEAGAASEACFSIDAIAGNIGARTARLDALPESEPGVGDLRRFLDGRFRPFLAELDAWTDEQARRQAVRRDAEIPLLERTLSPSDFGFHNALRDAGGRLVFVDFEYFGWDDPAKTIVDFLHHPAMPLTDDQRRAFAAGVLTVFADVAGLPARARLVYPWFGLKWCLIFLNEFVPEHLRRRSFAGVGGADRTGLLRQQLERANQLLDRVRAEYNTNPFLE